MLHAIKGSSCTCKYTAVDVSEGFLNSVKVCTALYIQRASKSLKAISQFSIYFT